LRDQSGPRLLELIGEPGHPTYRDGPLGLDRRDVRQDLAALPKPADRLPELPRALSQSFLRDEDRGAAEPRDVDPLQRLTPRGDEVLDGGEDAVAVIVRLGCPLDAPIGLKRLAIARGDCGKIRIVIPSAGRPVDSVHDRDRERRPTGGSDVCESSKAFGYL